MNTILKSFKARLMLILLLILFSGTRLMAQDGFDDNVDDQAPGLPINGLLVAGLVVGSVLGIKTIKNRNVK